MTDHSPSPEPSGPAGSLVAMGTASTVGGVLALVEAAIRGLSRLRTPGLTLVDLEQRLRRAVSCPDAGLVDSARAAIETACGYLACGDLDDAYFALLTARDLMARI